MNYTTLAENATSILTPSTDDDGGGHHDCCDTGQIWGLSSACVVTALIVLVVGAFIVYRLTKIAKYNAVQFSL